MITIEQASSLKYRDEIHHVRLRGSDGLPVRARVNGQLQTWARQPERFSLPMKHEDHLYLTEQNAHEWCATVEEAFTTRQPDVFLSSSGGFWRVIYKGLPATNDKRDKAKAMADAAATKVRLIGWASRHFWNGDAGKWEAM